MIFIKQPSNDNPSSISAKPTTTKSSYSITKLILVIFLNLFSFTATSQEGVGWGWWPAGVLGPFAGNIVCNNRNSFQVQALDPNSYFLPGTDPVGLSFVSGATALQLGMTGVTNGTGTRLLINFGFPIENVNFSIFDIDGSPGNWQDRITINPTLGGIATTANLSCPLGLGACTYSITGNQADANLTASGPFTNDTRLDVSIPGSIDAIEIVYNNHTIPVSTTQIVYLTQIIWSCPIIGVAKVMTRRAGQVFGVSPYIVDIDFNFENFGHVNLSNLTSLEDLDAVFNIPPNVGNYVVTSITKTSGPATFTANAGFDGSANQELIGIGSSLLPTETASIRVTLNVNNYDSYTNTITVNGTSPQSAITSDVSTDGADADGADADDNPDESTPSTLDVTLLPVSLNYFSAQKSNGQIHIEWQTDIEFAHLGFEIYQQNQDGSKDLISPFISQESTKQNNALKTYTHTINSENILPVWIVDINNKGAKTWHGPFKINNSFGTKILNSKISWSDVKQTNNPITSSTTANIDSLQVAVNTTGMQRINYADLVLAGMDLSNISPQNISIDLNGENIPLYINGNNTAFDNTTSFDFYATNIEDSIYTNTRVYKLSIKTNEFKHIQANNQTQSNVIDSWYWQTEHYNPNLIYDFSSPTNDPWRADKVATFASNDKTIEFPLDELSPLTNNDIELRIEISGGINYQNPPDIYPTDPNRCGANHLDLYPGIPNDHCVELSINQSAYSELVFDGLRNHIASYQLDQSHAVNGLLNINLKVQGQSGYPHDLVHIEDIAITYPRRLTATENKLEFQIAESTKIHNDLINQLGFEKNIDIDAPPTITHNLPAIEIDGFDSTNIVAYALDAGYPQRIQNIKSKVSPLGFSASIPAIAFSDKYWLSTQEALLKPSLSPWKDEIKIKDIATDYIIISHPDFIETAQQLANLHSSNGLSVKIVDINDIYNQFSDSIVDPLAIKDFIKHTNSNKALSYVLLIGADNYDYKGYLSSNHFSHIPSIYSAIDDIVRYAPADSLYTDLDGDNISDIAIGRLPVRTVEELQLLINKEIEFISQSTTTISSQFITDKQDDNYSYTQISNDLHALVPQWNILTANRDDYSSEAETKQKILDNFSQNPRLTTYLGHSGPRNWFSFPSAFTYNDIIDVNNSESPSVVMQWGCWNSYYVEPEANTMSHRFLFNNDKGAVAVFGASALTSVKSEKALAALILPELAKPKQTIGKAMLIAKKQLAEQGDYRDVIIGWNLLGDPALRLIYTQN